MKPSFVKNLKWTDKAEMYFKGDLTEDTLSYQNMPICSILSFSDFPIDLSYEVDVELTTKGKSVCYNQIIFHIFIAGTIHLIKTVPIDLTNNPRSVILKAIVEFLNQNKKMFKEILHFLIKNDMSIGDIEMEGGSNVW